MRKKNCFITCECTMTRTYLQYLIIFLKSASMLFFPNGSAHFLLALVNAFFLLLYLNNQRRKRRVLVFVYELRHCGYQRQRTNTLINSDTLHVPIERRISVHVMFYHLCQKPCIKSNFDSTYGVHNKGSHN